jgi:hypothetical protein
MRLDETDIVIPVKSELIIEEWIKRKELMNMDDIIYIITLAVTIKIKNFLFLLKLQKNLFLDFWWKITK